MSHRRTLGESVLLPGITACLWTAGVLHCTQRPSKVHTHSGGGDQTPLACRCEATTLPTATSCQFQLSQVTSYLLGDTSSFSHRLGVPGVLHQVLGHLHVLQDGFRLGVPQRIEVVLDLHADSVNHLSGTGTRD